jgi:hypothetical protein
MGDDKSPGSGYTYGTGGDGPKPQGASVRGRRVRQRLRMVDQAVRNVCIGRIQPNSLGEEP